MTASLFLFLAACAPDPLRDAVAPSDDPAEYLPLEHLATLGVHARRLDGAHVLLYGSSPDEWQHAVCAAPLECDVAECPTYEQAALAIPRRCANGGDAFERGVCGPFRWVATEHLMRYFDRGGALVAMLSSDASPAFCAGRASTELAGQIPVCHQPLVARHVCGATSWGTTEMLGELLHRMELVAGD